MGGAQGSRITCQRPGAGVEQKILVHPRGARHLVDPSKLMESATRIFGDEMGKLWGEMRPIPEEKVRVTDDGAAIPVTVLDVANNRVTQIKTPETDGYAAVQVTYGKRRASRVTKAQAGHLAKAGVEAGVVLKEFQIPADDLAKFKPGDVVGVDTFAVGQLVDVNITETRSYTLRGEVLTDRGTLIV